MRNHTGLVEVRTVKGFGVKALDGLHSAMRKATDTTPSELYSTVSLAVSNQQIGLRTRQALDGQRLLRTSELAIRI